MHKWKRNCNIIFAISMMVFCLVQSIIVTAHDVPDAGKRGSVTLQMHVGETAVSGGTLSLCKVGNVKEDDGNYDFILTDDFAKSGLSPDNLQDDTLAAKLSEYAKTQNIQYGTKNIGSDGKVVFDGLELGLYLFVQEEPAPGYEKVTPFLVSVPYCTEQGEYIYDVDVTPKVELKAATELKPTGSRLPQTGQLNWPIPILAAVGCMLLLLGCILRGDTKGKGNEKEPR